MIKASDIRKSMEEKSMEESIKSHDDFYDLLTTFIDGEIVRNSDMLNDSLQLDFYYNASRSPFYRAKPILDKDGIKCRFGSKKEISKTITMLVEDYTNFGYVVKVDYTKSFFRKFHDASHRTLIIKW